MTELATKNDATGELAHYGDRDDVRDFGDRLMRFLPNGKKLGIETCLALAQVGIALGLNPLVGEVWAIPDGKGGYTISPGVKGLRKKAHEQGKYQVTLRPATKEELEGVTLNKGDIARACDLYMMTPHALEVLRLTGREVMFTGLAIIRKNDRTKMEHIQCVRKRAEADALKQAFDLSALGTYVEEPPEQWQIDNQARDTALPYEQPSRGRDDLFKSEEPRPEPAGDVVEGEVVSSESQEYIEERHGFYQDLLMDVMDPMTGKPYFNHLNHVIATVKKVGIQFVPGNEVTMLELIEAYVDKRAHQKANAEAAAEQGRMM